MTAPLNTASLVSELRKPAPKFGLEEFDPTYDARQEAAAALESTTRALSEKEGECERSELGRHRLGHALREATRQRDEALAALRRLVEAKALRGVREVVAGWNGEGRADGPYQRHDARLGATLPKTNCGAVYELDEAMTEARSVLENGPAPLADATKKDPGTEQREAGV